MTEQGAGDECTSLELVALRLDGAIRSEDPGGKRRNMCHLRAKTILVKGGFWDV